MAADQDDQADDARDALQSSANSKTESHTNKEVIERARDTLKKKQTTIDFFQAGSQKPIRHKSAEPSSKRSLSDRASSDSDSMADKRKKGGCTVNSVESKEGETTELRSTATDWFEHSETESPPRLSCAPKLTTF